VVWRGECAGEPLGGGGGSAAGAAGADAWLALWAGQNASSARPMPAADLVRRLVDETDDVLRAPHLRPRTP
jgi:hypothetical protein